MLVLTRKSEQKIIIGKQKNIIITVLKVQGDQVSLGIQADGDIPIYREELLKDLDTTNTHDLLESNPAETNSLVRNLQIKTRRRNSDRVSNPS